MCGVSGCDRVVYARGHCSRHYKQLLRHGAVQPDSAPAGCAVASCERAAVTRGWCHGHYLRWNRTGGVREDVPLARPERDACAIEACVRGAVSAGYCRSHSERLRKHGDPLAGGPVRTVTGDGSISHGYWLRPVRADERRLVPDGRRSELEHRLVMAALLGRPLQPDASVHHVNGQRLDNRPENLELWSTSQPRGQRVVDKLAWAWELIAHYDPEAARALGLDIDPDTGLPRNDERPAT